MEILGISSVAVITVVAYLVGLAVRETPINNKWIPVIVGTVGGVLGIVGMLTIEGFPATDILTSIAVGIVSGLAATGADQITKQLGLNVLRQRAEAEEAAAIEQGEAYEEEMLK